ncbi:hypothetical protein Mgra_00008814 [Meloidogyne graminicola]|uniref:Uncharacterized protein n=1 Tax=Meloidogyne graminicola TaxID=189291 RepID=A0A8S9ZEN9_9BILA|nr:hypothetical protein Mgra_00008814 [Meloidogyne graminicola]
MGGEDILVETTVNNGQHVGGADWNFWIYNILRGWRFSAFLPIFRVVNIEGGRVMPRFITVFLILFFLLTSINPLFLYLVLLFYLPIPVIDENINNFSTTPLPSIPLTSSIFSIFPSEISLQLPTFDQLLAQKTTFFGFTPLIPLGMEITTSKNEEDLERKMSKKEVNNSTVTLNNNSKSCFSSSKQAGIKVRFNSPMFDDVSHNIFNAEAKHLQIPPQKQCFLEGCFRLHTFQIIKFQKPETFTLKPLGPNLCF